jgi:hypothetical protein
MSYTIEMPRKAVSYRIDERILSALEAVAKDGNISVNRYLENLMLSHLKGIGKIDMGLQPLGETRGSEKGERRGGKGTKKKPEEAQSESPEDTDT